MPDVLVAGAGPAGLATALHAAAAGLDTLVLDPRAGSIDKACGEGLMPSAVEHLRRLGVAVPGRPFRGIRYVERRRSAEATFAGGPGMGVRRTSLHSALTSACLAAGVRIEQASVTSVRQDADQVIADGVRARWLVAADGLHSPIRRAVGLDVRSSAGRPRWGQRQHFEVEPWTDLVEVHWAHSSEAYVTPISDDRIGVAVLTGVRGSFTQQLQAFPELADRLPTRAVTAVRGAGPLRQRSRSRVAGRVLLVGDAAGYVDALTGEGISVSLRCAEALVACLVDGAPARYDREWLAASRRYRTLTGALLWTRQRRLLRPAIVPIASAVPPLFRAAVHQLAR